MAEFYTWNDKELGLAVKEMDDEHKMLVAKMNALYRGVELKESPDKIGKLVKDLAEFTVKHFSDEEAYMEKINFPGLATHKIIHQQLLAQFKTYSEEFQKTKTLSPAFFNFLKVWLTSHIRGIDKKYSDHSHAKKKVS